MNKQYLLIVVGILVMAKFVIVPVWDWQNEKITQIAQLQSRLEKADSLSEQGSDFKQILNQAKGVNREKLASIHVTNDIAALKLSKMEELDLLMAGNDVRVTSSSWMANSGSDLTILNLKLGVRGSTKNIFKSVLAIRQLNQATVISDISFRIVKMEGDTLGDAGGSMTVSFYVLGPELAERYALELPNVAE